MTSEPKFSPTLQASTAQRVATWARHAQARDVVRRAAIALGPATRVMPLKGVLLGALGIVHPAERPIRDADVLLDGISLTQAVRKLGSAGFRLTDIPWSHGYVSLAHAAHPSLWLDVHIVLMPIGFGRLTPRYMFADARVDEALFGAPVHVPAPAALMVQLIANVVKDRVVLAFDHVPNDLACVARTLDPMARARVVDDLRALALAHRAARALAWAFARTPEPALDDLLRRLEPSEDARKALPAEIEAMATADHGSLWARMRARTGADHAWLQGLAAAFTAASILTHPLRKAWLMANNRGDAQQDLR